MYWILEVKNGKLTTMPHPKGGDELEAELRAWQQAGADVVVSMLTAQEETELRLEQEQALCQKLGMSFISFPISDMQLPDSQAATLAIAQTISNLLNEGKGVALHCWAGIGRSSMIAACTLVQQGFAPEVVFDLISKARGRPVPDTEEQRQWVLSLP